MVKGERSGYRQDPVISIVQAADRYISLTGKEYGTRKIYDGQARPSQRGRQRPPPGGQASRDPHPGGQRPSPVRAPTRTSRRAGIDQGDLPHTKVTTSSLRMQGDRKEQHSSHSLNQWKERFDLWHRDAGMITGIEPYKLRGILNKEPRSLMTRFGPSHERGPGTQPHIGRTSNILVSFQLYMLYSVLSMCSIERKSNVTIREDKSMVRTMTQCFIQCFYRQGSGPILHTSRRQSPTSVIPWKCEILERIKGVKGFKGIKGIS